GIIIKTKNKMLMALTVFLILFVLIGSASAAKDNTTTLSQNTTKNINQEKIGIGDSSLNKEILKKNTENTTLKEPVSGGTFNDIQTAINNAADGETVELSGLYTGDGTVITLNKTLTIIGTNDATLDAKGKSAIFYITKEKTTLKNIKFINGNSNIGGAIEYWQVMYSDESSIINCTFINNTANEGGAIGKLAYKNKIKNCTFLNNTANSGGGAIYMDSASRFEIRECTFTNNKANGEGGAIKAWGGKGNTISNCNFTNNNANSNGGAIHMWKSAEWEIKQCTFIHNTGSDGGAIHLINGEDNKVNYCTFINNTGNKGGAIHWTDENNAKILNSNFKYNKAGSFKNIYTNKEDLTLSGCSLDTVVSIDPLSDCVTGSSAIVNLTFDDGTNIGGYNVILKNNNQTIKTFTYNSNHRYTYTWNNLAVGEYSITVNESNENNNKYIASYEPVHFTVYKKAINPNDINVIINPGKGNVTINIQAPTDLTNTMSIIIDGKNYTIPVIGGTGNNTIILTPGKHNLTGINITDNPIYNETFILKTDGNFTVNRIDINPNDINIMITPAKGEVTLNVTTPKNFTGIMNVIIDGKNYTIPIVDGTGNKTIALIPGKHNLTGINITDDPIYDDVIISKTDGNFTVYKKDINPSDVNVTATPGKGNVTINIKAPTDFTGNINIIIDNVSYPVELVNGVGFKLIILLPGNHNITGVNITNNQVYNDIFIQENISFVVIKKDTIITAKDASFIINYGGQYTVSTNLGNGKTITLIINNRKINAITDTNGIATFKLTKTNLAPAGKKTTTITFNGDENYTSKTINTKITVNKEKTKITGKSAKKIYKKTANKKLKIVLKSNTGKSLGKVKINLKAKKLKGKLGKKLKKGYDITVKFNKKGIGYIILKNSQVNGFKKGTYKFSITYKGSNTYKPSTSQIKMKIK
ncbi:MAG: hypothetical protein IKF11_06810, partial [Methanobrevibacter sp.]|nr:hypothetical protein [Methanobrevibacter sp.]